VEAALFGAAGALGTLQAERLVVDHSTVSVAGTAERSARLKTGGWSYLHAPMLAGPTGVAKGEGLMMVAGAKDIYDSAAPTLAQILERRWYIGESAPDAAAFKLMANSLLLSAAEAMSEFFDIASASGIERDRAMRLFEHFDPSKTYTLRGSRMANRDYAPAFAASMAAKDARLMIEAAHAGGADLPSIEATLKRLKRLVDEGHGDLDLSALALEKKKG
jgi:3-hydroxyisobutyrate dehydrogenase